MPPPSDPLADHLAPWPTWRVLALAVGTVAAVLLAVVLVATVGAATAPASPLSGRLHQAAVGLPTVVALYWAAHRYLLRWPAAWFLAARPDRRLLGWVAVGLAFPAGVIGFDLVVLDATVAAGPPPSGVGLTIVLTSLAAGLMAGVLEELALRGALLRLLEARWGPRLAVGATAAVFSLLHQGHATDPTSLALVLSSMAAAGLLLGTVVVRTRCVWHAVAVHAGWNAVMGGRVVAVARPGERLAPSLVQVRLHEPVSWFTGGEATLSSAPSTTLLLLAAALVVARYRGSGATGGPSTGTPTASQEEP